MIPQQDTQKALIEQLRRLADEREATGADDPCPIDVECDHCDTVRAMREAADALEALSESSASEETPLAGLKERLRVALTEKSFHSCRVGPMHGPMRDEPAILLSNAIDVLCNVMDASSETQEERSDEHLTRVRELLMTDQQTYDVPGFGVGWYLISREKMKALLAEVAQSSPSPSAETPPSPTISVEASRLLKLLANKGFTCDCGLGEDDIDEVVAFLKQVAELGHAHPITTREEEGR